MTGWIIAGVLYVLGMAPHVYMLQEEGYTYRDNMSWIVLIWWPITDAMGIFYGIREAIREARQ